MTALVSASTLAGRKVPPRIWHWPDWIPGRTVTLLTGDGGGGKTTLALQLAVATAADAPWLGRSPLCGPVVYLSAEDDLDELHRRLDEICVGQGLDFRDLADLHLWPLADQDAVLAIEGSGGGVDATALWSEFAAAVARVAPALVIVDSLADVYGANENIRAQVRQFIGMLRRLAMTGRGCAVLLLSHPSLAGMASGSGSSGSTAWNNSVRSRIYLTKPTDEDANPDERILSLKKANYTRAQVDMRLRREAGGFMLQDGGAPSGSLDMALERQRVDAVFLRLLEAYEAQGRHVSDKPGANYAPTVFARDPAAKGSKRHGLEAAMNRLFAAKAIRVDMIGRPSRQVRKLSVGPATPPEPSAQDAEVADLAA